ENVTTSMSLYLSNDMNMALSPSLMDLTLDLGKREISDLKMLQSCASLSSLDLQNGTVKDLSALTSLPIQNLRLMEVNVQDLTPVWQCTQLTSLSIINNKNLTSLEGIQALENLSLADFSGSKLVDVSPLASCTNLVTVNLSSCDQVRDVSSLIGLPSLKRLTV